MLTHRGFSAWITCNGVIVPELKVEIDEGSHVASCWIPSHDGKPFSVHWQDHGSYVDTSGYIYLDGHMVPGRFLFGYGETERGAMRVGTDAEVPFVFAKTAEDEGHDADKETNVIKLKLKRIRRVASRPANQYTAAPKPKSAPRGAHRIEYGKERPAVKQMPQTWTTEAYDPQEPEVYVTFVFKYRPIDTLVAEKIAELAAVAVVSDEEDADQDGEEDAEHEEHEPVAPETLLGVKRKPSLLTPSPSPNPSSKKLKTTSRTPSCASSKGESLAEIDTEVQTSSSQDSSLSVPSFSFDSPVSLQFSDGDSKQPSPNRKYYRY